MRTSERRVRTLRPLSACAVAAATSAALALAPAPAAAETLTCTEIVSLPAVLSTQGTYCMKKDLATGIGTGAAISIAVNNVVLDCNGYKLGGLAAGAGTATIGIESAGRNNVLVRGCNVRGFLYGVALHGSESVPMPYGLIVEDSRFDGNTRRGLWVGGTGSVVRRNLVLDTGGAAVAGSTTGIVANGTTDVLDNIISGVDGGTSFATGITVANDGEAAAPGILVAGNRIRNLSGDVGIRGIYLFTPQGVVLRRNLLATPEHDSENYAFLCDGAGAGLLYDNVAVGFGNLSYFCEDVSGNVHMPPPIIEPPPG